MYDLTARMNTPFEYRGRTAAGDKHEFADNAPVVVVALYSIFLDCDSRM